MLGMKRAVQFQGAQQLLPDRVVVRMAPGAQACFVQRLGPPVKSAEQWSPIDNIMLRELTTPSAPDHRLQPLSSAPNGQALFYIQCPSVEEYIVAALATKPH